MKLLDTNIANLKQFIILAVKSRYPFCTVATFLNYMDVCLKMSNELEILPLS